MLYDVAVNTINTYSKLIGYNITCESERISSIKRHKSYKINSPETNLNLASVKYHFFIKMRQIQPTKVCYSYEKPLLRLCPCSNTLLWYYIKIVILPFKLRLFLALTHRAVQLGYQIAWCDRYSIHPFVLQTV